MIKEPFSSLLNGNYSLDSLELAAIQHEIEAETLAIDKIQSTIIDLQLQLEEHEARRQDYKTLLSPLRRGVVPPEILGEVFRYAIEPLYPVDRVGLVCKSWRDIALTTPSLWQTVVMLPSDAPINVKRLRTCTARAGTLPKTVRIIESNGRYRCECRDSESEVDSCRLASPELVRFFTDGPVLDNVDLRSPTHHCLDRLFGLLKSDKNTLTRSWDSIRHLALKVGDWSTPTHGLEWQFLHNLPPVSSLFLDTPWLPDVPGDALPALPSLDCLTSLHMVGDWPNSWILRNLRNCPNLEEVVLNSKESERQDDVWTEGRTLVSLPKLQVLRFQHMATHGEDARILQWLRMPSLRILELSYEIPEPFADQEEDPDTPGKVQLYRDMLRMLSGADGVVDLQQLRLEYFPITAKGLLRILGALPSLISLELATHIGSDRKFFKMAREIETPLLPQLRHLKIQDTCDVFDPDDVCEFLRQRKATATEASPDCVERLDMAVNRYNRNSLHLDESVRAMRGMGILVNIVP
ncbi:hypothetical protein DFP72DRAFT_1162357 [Ephemerocybe angulata]|uniref:F-box domain-containing protein n=1 Tax=Ephemerocybe angulata TaxID=980116 RepID=A0A8H6II77_9AGAR|nr:hypothetical protein DFP72DRAFT_1162357 [Tulosesus angulatus]